MKLFKLMATTAVTAVMASALAVSASAALTATYTAPTTDAAGSVALSGIETTADQKTLLILNNDATNVVEGDIVQIDQDETLTSVAVGDLAATIDAANQTALDAYEASAKDTAAYETLTAAWTASTNYYVRVGGGDTIETYTLVVNTTKVKPEAPSTGGGSEGGSGEAEYLLGDVDTSGYIDTDDALEILNYDAGYGSVFDDFESEEEELGKGDVDSSGYVDTDDALEILMYDAGYDSIIDWE